MSGPLGYGGSTQPQQSGTGLDQLGATNQVTQQQLGQFNGGLAGLLGAGGYGQQPGTMIANPGVDPMTGQPYDLNAGTQGQPYMPIQQLDQGIGSPYSPTPVTGDQGPLNQAMTPQNLYNQYAQTIFGGAPGAYQPNFNPPQQQMINDQTALFGQGVAGAQNLYNQAMPQQQMLNDQTNLFRNSMPNIMGEYFKSGGDPSKDPFAGTPDAGMYQRFERFQRPAAMPAQPPQQTMTIPNQQAPGLPGFQPRTPTIMPRPAVPSQLGMALAQGLQQRPNLIGGMAQSLRPGMNPKAPSGSRLMAPRIKAPISRVQPTRTK